MNAVVVDTHTAIWYLLQSPKLSKTAQKAIDSASKIYISSITIVEIIYLTEKGRIPQLALTRLLNGLNQPLGNWQVVAIDLDIALSLAKIEPQVVPEMPDRIITATALYLNLPLTEKAEEKIAVTLYPDLETYDYMQKQGALFDQYLPELLNNYEGYYIYFENGQVLEADKDEENLLDLVERKYGLKPMFIEKVARKNDI